MASTSGAPGGGAIERLILFAGPPRSGKSTATDRLQADYTASRFFTTPTALLPVYARWLAVAGGYPARAHWLIETTAGTPELAPAATWPALCERLR
jgi:hypothetical protein